MVRGLAQAVYPVFNHLTVGFFTFTYQQLPFVNPVTEPVYSFLRSFLLPASQKFFQLAYLSFFMLLGVLLLEAVQRRFFCRNICPLGSLLGLIGRVGRFAGYGGNDDCRTCRICSTSCRMGAIDEQRTIDMARCTVCYECMEKCPRQIINFGFSSFGYKNNKLTLSRRKFIGAGLLGMLLPAVKGVRVQAKNPDPLLIRLPGPWRTGISASLRSLRRMYPGLHRYACNRPFCRRDLTACSIPILVARSGYCEFNCTLCGQVCPTGAIGQLDKEQKHQWKIGHRLVR